MADEANQNIPLIPENDEDDNDDIWDQIVDPDFAPAEQFVDEYDQLNQVLLQNLQAGHDNTYIHCNGFPMLPEPVQDVQAEDAAFSTHSLHNVSDVVQVASSSQTDAQSSSPTAAEKEVLNAFSFLNRESGEFINNAYMTESSDLSEFVASTEIQPDALLIDSKETSIKENLEETPKALKSDFKTFFDKFRSNNETTPPNPPNSPVSVHNESDSTLETTPKFPRSPIQSIRKAMEALRNRLEARMSRRYLENSTGAVTANISESERILQIPSPMTDEVVEETRSRNENEAAVQVSAQRDHGRPVNLYLKFGSFMVVLVLIFPLAIVACLEELLPQNYMNVFFAFWVLSFVAACYFFMKAYRDRNAETSDGTGSTVKYGSIETSPQGTSEQS